MPGHRANAAIPAVLLSPPQPEAFGAISRRRPTELLPILGRPFLSRIFEVLSELGISHVTVYADVFAAQFEEFILDGQRWGLVAEVADMSSVGNALKQLAQRNTPCLLGSTHQLPELTNESVAVNGNWLNSRFSSGGATLNWGIVNQWPESSGDSAIEMFFDEHDFVETELAGRCLHINSPNSLVTASKDLFSGKRPELLIGGSNVEPDIYIGHNVIIHPTATINPPVFLGPDVTIGRGVRLGPFATVEGNSIIDDMTIVESSIVMPGTYVGSGLELENSIVDRNYLVYSDSDVVPVGDSFLVGPSETHLSSIPSFTTRLVTLLIAVVLLPLFLFLVLLGSWCAKRLIIKATTAVRLPAPEDPKLWRTFRHYEFSSDGPALWQWLMGLWPLRGMPTLFNIICGHVSWVGVAPREAEDLASLPDDWQQLILTGRNGLIRLAELDKNRVHDDSLDQKYSSEAFYIATHNVKQDLGLFFRALTHWRIY